MLAGVFISGREPQAIPRVESHQQQRSYVMLKHLLAGSLAVAFVVPAVAADQYYIVRGPDKKCTVVEEKPTTTGVTVMGNTIFKTRSEAETSIKTICTD